MTTEQEKTLAILQHTEDLKWFEDEDGAIYEGVEAELVQEWKEENEELTEEERLPFIEWLQNKDLELDIEEYDEDTNDWLVCTDEEADERWDIELDNFIEECVLPELPSHYRSYFDDEKYKEDCKYDGRGHTLARYDGHEHEEIVNGTIYYLYRIN